MNDVVTVNCIAFIVFRVAAFKEVSINTLNVFHVFLTHGTSHWIN
jgi:hypothetical protein